MELRRTTSVVFLAKTGTAVSTFLGFVVFARTLGGDSFGSFILFLTVLNLVGGVSDLGLDDAVEKRISEGAEGNVLASTLAIKATALAAISTLLVAGRPHLQAFVGADLAGWLIVALVTQQVGLVFNRSLKGEMRVAEAESALFVGKFAFVTSGVAALQYVTRIETLVASFWFGWFVVLVWGVARKRTPLGRVDRSSVGSLYAYAKFNFVASVLGRRMYSWVDVFVLGLFLSNAAVGAYELAWRLAGVVMLLSRSIGTAIFPQISRWDASGSGEKIQELLPQALFSSLFLVIPAVGGVFVLSEPLMRIVFSPEYLVAAGALVVLSLGKTPEAMNVITGRALLGLDRPRDTAVAGGVLIVSNVLLNFALVPTFARVGPE
jgi:O-antigen/teichoic acid export membrane protein